MDSANWSGRERRTTRGGGELDNTPCAFLARAVDCTCSCCPGLVDFLVFRYLPLLGNVIAFQDYSPFLGFESPWVGFENFAQLFTDPDIGVAIRNTLEISLLQLIFFFPAPIALALLLNSMVSESAKRFMQSVLYLPHFISWVIIIALWQQLFGGAGLLNQALRESGHRRSTS